MATLAKGYSFGATESVTNAKLHALVDSATITGIVNADIAAGAAIDFSKITQSDIDGSKLTGLANIVSGAGVIPTANLTSVAQKGANSDITSLAGLTTPLSVAQGGTGESASPLPIAKGGTNATSAANARTALGLAIGTDVLAPNGDGSALTGISQLSNTVFSFGYYTTAATSYDIVAYSVFKKIAGVNTVTIYAYMKIASGNTASVQTTIAGCTASTLTTTSATYAQVTGTIDVSGLTTNSVYAVTIGLQTSWAPTAAFLGGIIGIAS